MTSFTWWSEVEKYINQRHLVSVTNCNIFEQRIFQATIRKGKAVSSLARDLLSLSLKKVSKHLPWHCRPCNDKAKQGCQMPGWHNCAHACGDDGTTKLTTNANHEVVASACPSCFQPFAC